ncbi:hypothetical protein [Paenibacillus koleovorans]|uniref:hypothetical protein n=1 Tax=Paenibacillus koleovorans TaxID=121608 RepID=UPI0035A242D8
MPSDEQLKTDLENMVENYKLFVEKRGALTTETPRHRNQLLKSRWLTCTIFKASPNVCLHSLYQTFVRTESSF